MVVKKRKAAAPASTKATAAIIDFSNVKERGNFNPKNIEPGDYAATVAKVEQTEAKSDGEPMWLFTITLDDVPRATYPIYCKLVENQYWKIKSLCNATGIDVGQRKVKLDPNKLVGKELAVSVEDDEYEGRMKSVIIETFPLDDLDPVDGDTEPEDNDLEEEEEPPRKKRKRPAPVEEEDEDEEDEEEEEPAPKRRAKKASAKKAPARKKRRPVEDEDEDDDELEIDEL